MSIAAALITSAVLALPLVRPSDADLAGTWRAWLESPGGRLHFGLEIVHPEEGAPHAWILNGEERLPVPRVTIVGETLVLHFEHYDSIVRATAVDFTREKSGSQTEHGATGTRALSGHWKKPSGPESWTNLAFMAFRGDDEPDDGTPEPSPGDAVTGRWSVKFSSSDDPAVGIFDVDESGHVTGTFLTTLGDYRYLGGTFDGTTLELSCFDGAHAFLFRADVQPDGSLRGDFWSRDTWHETWTAVRDDDAALPDAWNLTSWTNAASLGSFRFLNVDGERIALDDPRFAGKAGIIEVFGTWCPNCYDASRYLVELDEQYGDRGLEIIGLAFEITGDERRDREQVKTYINHHGIKYPVLLAGVSDKAEATKAFPLLDRVRSYPTFIFLDADNQVRGIYTGFSGPATGDAHTHLRESFERLIEQMLGK